MTSLAVLTRNVSRIAGGLYWSIQPLCYRLSENSVDVRIFAGRDDYVDSDIESWDPVDVRPLDTRYFHSYGYCPALMSELSHFSPDVVHLHGLWTYSSLAVLKWCKSNAIPYVVSAHGMLDNWALKQSRCKKLAALKLYEFEMLVRSTCLHALCSSELTSIRDLGITNPVAIIPNGVDPPQPGSDAKQAEWQSRIPSSSDVLLFLGRIHPKKNIESILKAWSLLDREHGRPAHDWHFVIAGWGDQRYIEKLKSLAAQLSLDSTVHFVGSQIGVEKGATFRRANAFILPSYSEGLPMAVLEAWSYKLPVLMTKECNLNIGYQEQAAMEISRDPAVLASQISQFMRLEQRDKAAMGQRGRSLIERDFSWYAVADQMSALYRWLLNGGEPPSFVDIDG